DAWTGGEVTRQVERTLGPDKYHSRLPWFAAVTGKDSVLIRGETQEILDREIDYAADAGLDYWAFLLYPAADPMSRPLELYRSSSRRGRLGFCVILHNNLGVSEAEWPRERDRVIALLRQPSYQKVRGGRPLVYVFSASVPRFAALRAAIRAAGLDPYYVGMDWNPAPGTSAKASLTNDGYQGTSAYAYGSSVATFAELARAVEENYWRRAVRVGVPYVPLVTTGWDKRPRKDNPVSWEKDAAYHWQTVFTARATPGEIADHLRRALTFVNDHPDLCEANAVILYAWNEFDEGGWLAPTWTASGRPDNRRLEAIRGVLRPGTK
ncbi:MAG: hypothetical protein V4671_00475, partial [Armatimonadota bacterium]